MGTATNIDSVANISTRGPGRGTGRPPILKRHPWLGVLPFPVPVLFKRVPAGLAVGMTEPAALVLAAATLSLPLLLPFSLYTGNGALSAVLTLRWPVYAAALTRLFQNRPDWLRTFETTIAAVILTGVGRALARAQLPSIVQAD